MDDTKNELLKVLKDALAELQDRIYVAYRPASAKEERTATLLEDLIDVLD